jgi:hypothetical protein
MGIKPTDAHSNVSALTARWTIQFEENFAACIPIRMPHVSSVCDVCEVSRTDMLVIKGVYQASRLPQVLFLFSSFIFSFLHTLYILFLYFLEYNTCAAHCQPATLLFQLFHSFRFIKHCSINLYIARHAH